MSDFKGNNQNTGRLTRGAAKKRSEGAAPIRTTLAKRHRVALAELKNLPNLPLPLHHRTSSEPKTHECPEHAPPVVAVDAHVDDPQLCVSYATDIDLYLRRLESDPGRRPRDDYVGTIQKDVTAAMRGILVDWLVDAGEEYRLTADTLYLTVSYIDKFLSRCAIERKRLQLLGVSCMLIAAKYEEIRPPHVEDFCYITDNTYTKKEVVNMETDVLKILNFDVGNPTIKTFLRRFTRAGINLQSRSLQLEFLCSYLAELSLVDYGCLRFLPSVIAASSVFLAKLMLSPGTHPWDVTLQQYTGYRSSQLKDCILAIHDLQLNKAHSMLVAVRAKYNQHKFKFVTALPSPQEIPSLYFEDIGAQRTEAITYVQKL